MSTMVFDLDGMYGEFCTGLVKNKIGFKLVLTAEEWAPNWTLPWDDRPHVFVSVGPWYVTGRDIIGGWRVYLCGGDDTEMFFDIEDPIGRYIAVPIFKSIGDYVTRRELEEKGFRT